MTFLILSTAGRLLERIIDASGGLLCLFFGYKLFAGYAADVTKTEISGKGFTFKAERIGPGVFFALFGAVVLVYSLSSPIKVSRDAGEMAQQPAQSNAVESTSSTTTERENFDGVLDVGSANVAKSRLKSLVTYEQIAEMSAGEEAVKIQAARIGLQGIKVELVDAIFGKTRRVEWQSLVSMRSVQQADLSKKLSANPALEKRFQEIEDAITTGF